MTKIYFFVFLILRQFVHRLQKLLHVLGDMSEESHCPLEMEFPNQSKFFLPQTPAHTAENPKGKIHPQNLQNIIQKFMNAILSKIQNIFNHAYK